MKYGYRICFHQSIEWNENVKECLSSFLEWFSIKDSYKSGYKKSFFRRNVFGRALDENFKRVSSLSQTKYVFRRVSKNRRIFALIPVDFLDIDIENDCMCRNHLGGERIKMKERFIESDYIIFAEVGDIKG